MRKKLSRHWIWMKHSRAHALTSRVHAKHQMKYTLKGYVFDCTDLLAYTLGFKKHPDAIHFDEYVNVVHVFLSITK